MKEIKIEIPAGYEIDMDKSNLSKGIVKFKKIKFTYEDLLSEKCNYYLDVGGVEKADYPISSSGYLDGNEFFSQKQAESLLAFNKLVNVAKVLNNGWKPDWYNFEENKYYLFYNNRTSTLDFSVNSSVYTSDVYFKSKELAKQAIEILGVDTIKLALGIGSL